MPNLRTIACTVICSLLIASGRGSSVSNETNEALRQAFWGGGRGSIKAARAALRRRANPNAMTQQCESTAHCRVLENSACSGTDPLEIATANDCAGCVERLLKAGARFDLPHENVDDEPNAYRWFDLIGSAGPETLAVYLAHGLDLQARNKHRQTLLHVAATGDKTGSIEWLVRHGVDVDAMDDHDQTPLMLAVSSGRIAIVQALLDAKANVSIHDASGSTAKVLAYGSALPYREYRPDSKHAGPKSLAMIRLLESYGAAEYAGDHLPSSSFDSELLGKSQRDLTGEFYRELPFLPPSLRFFAAYKGVLPSPFFTGMPSTTFFAVQPGNKVIKLVNVQHLWRVGMQLRSPQDALAFVRFASGDGEIGTRFFHMQFEGIELMELPEASECISYSPEPFKAAGIKSPSVETVNSAGKETYFVVTRFMIPRSSDLDGLSGSVSITNVTRVSERVTVTGRYSLTGKTVATPGLQVRQCMRL